ncbi:hypothetical protein D9Q98_001139 [Chlorella vulgaris]|uniref:Uncharacterized protein n=1 Tax=Chlorella vulgaris TaxID=3077 RepID=A0A9D4U0I1_CHLVU|nr:hypothetical protein D9Q98_001139 [Chlorella vulgaris]
MSSINFIRELIKSNMEGASERDAKWETKLHDTKAAAAANKANMAHPTKAWGFWRNDKHTAKFEMNADPAISKLPGRRSGASRLADE